MIKNYRKKPIVVRAVQWTGDNYDEIDEFARDNEGGRRVFKPAMPAIDDGYLTVNTGKSYIEDRIASHARLYVGDYLVEDISGNVYPCTKEVFEKTHEEVEGDNNG